MAAKVGRVVTTDSLEASTQEYRQWWGTARKGYKVSVTGVSETAQQAGRELSTLEVTRQALVLRGRDRPPGEPSWGAWVCQSTLPLSWDKVWHVCRAACRPWTPEFGLHLQAL